VGGSAQPEHGQPGQVHRAGQQPEVGVDAGGAAMVRGTRPWACVTRFESSARSGDQTWRSSSAVVVDVRPGRPDQAAWRGDVRGHRAGVRVAGLAVPAAGQETTRLASEAHDVLSHLKLAEPPQ
jgi:hypothetical protein